MYRQLLALILVSMTPLGSAQAQQADPDPALSALLRQAISESDSFADRFEAEVWLKLNSPRVEKFVPDAEERLAILRHVHYEARRASLPPELVLAVIEVESAFDRYALSRAYARGLMQVMPFWLKEIGRPDDDLMDIRTNLRMGCTILRYYLDKEDWEYIPALARYNGSYGKPDYPRKVMNKWTRNWTP